VLPQVDPPPDAPSGCPDPAQADPHPAQGLGSRRQEEGATCKLGQEIVWEQEGRDKRAWKRHDDTVYCCRVPVSTRAAAIRQRRCSAPPHTLLCHRPLKQASPKP
jgi:hypothetical protein